TARFVFVAVDWTLAVCRLSSDRHVPIFTATVPIAVTSTPSAAIRAVQSSSPAIMTRAYGKLHAIPAHRRDHRPGSPAHVGKLGSAAHTLPRSAHRYRAWTGTSCPCRCSTRAELAAVGAP